MNLHDWIDELCDVLDLEDVEVDESLLADLAVAATDNVERLAGPVTTYLLGYAAASHGARPDAVEELATRAQELAESWDRPADASGTLAADEPPADGGEDDYSGDLDLGEGDEDDLADQDDDPGATAGTTADASTPSLADAGGRGR